MIYIPVDNVQANYLLKPSTVSKSLKSSLLQIAMVSSKGMLNSCYLNFLGVKLTKFHRTWSVLSSAKLGFIILSQMKRKEYEHQKIISEGS